MPIERERQDTSFEYIPFANRPTYASFEKQLKHPKVHNIKLGVDFSGLEFLGLEGKFCPHCQKPYCRVVRDFKKGWGDIEQLNCIVPQTPQIECGCRLWIQIEQPVKERMAEALRTIGLIYRVVESTSLEAEDGNLAVLKNTLEEDDYNKVADWMFNQRVPEGSLSAILRAKRAVWDEASTQTENKFTAMSLVLIGTRL